MKYVLMATVILLYVGLLVAARIGVCRWHWHPKRSYEFIGFDGCSNHVRCGKCGYKGMLDSNGDLF